VTVRSLARRAAIAATVAVVCFLCVAAYLRRDTTAEFYRARGRYAPARELAAWNQGGSRCRTVELRNDRGEDVATAYVRVPFPAAPAYRVIVTYVGEKTGRTILELIPPAPDELLVAVQYPYQSPHGLLAHLRWPYDLRRVVYRTVAGGMLAVTYLERAGFSTARLTVLGASLGTPFAVIHGALDRRVTSFLLVHGGVDLPGVLWSIEQRQGHRWRAGLAAGVAAVLVTSFDPLRYVGRIAPRPLTILATRNDRYFPVASVQALYDRAGQPKRLLWTDSEHVGARQRELVAVILSELERRLAEDDPLPAPPASR